MSTCESILSHYFMPDGPGAAVAVIDEDADPVFACIGMADKARGIPVDTNTRFDLASTGKLITATLVMRLIEDGYFLLDTPVTELLDCMTHPKSGRPITVRDLLSHTADLTDYLAEGKFAESGSLTQSAVLERLGYWSESARPGQAFEYSNTHYVVLAEVCTQVLGMPFDDCLRTLLTEPHALEGLATIHQVTKNQPLAQGYLAITSGLSCHERVSSEIETLGDGGITSSIEAMARFASRFFGDRILDQSTRQAMCLPGKTDQGMPFDYGLGIQIENEDGSGWLGHAGSWVGTTAILGQYTARNRIVVVLSNEEMAPVERLSWQLMTHS